MVQMAKNAGTGLSTGTRVIAYLASALQPSGVDGAALTPAARAGDLEVLLTAFAALAPQVPTADESARFDVFMQQTLAQCGAEDDDATCASPAFLTALNALAPSIARSFVVRVAKDADDLHIPAAREQSLRQVLIIRYGNVSTTPDQPDN
jgi:hypothetical protein